MAWFNCTASQSQMAFSVEYQGVTILPKYRPFFVIEGDQFTVEFQPSFSQKWLNNSLQITSGTFSSHSSSISGAKVEFNIKDEFGNKIDTILKNRNNPDLGKLDF